MSEPIRRNSVVAVLGTPDRVEGSLNSPVELEEHGIAYNEKWLYEHLHSDPAGVPIRRVYWHRYDFMGTLVRANEHEEWHTDDKLAEAAADRPARLEPLKSGHTALTPSNRYRPVSQVKGPYDVGGYVQTEEELSALVTERTSQG